MTQLLLAVALCIAGALALVHGTQMWWRYVSRRRAARRWWHALRRPESLRLSEAAPSLMVWGGFYET